MKLGGLSLTARLALGFVTVLVMAHIGICMYLDYAFQQEFENEDYRLLSGNAAYIGQVVSERGTLDHLLQDPSRLHDLQSRHAGMLMLLKDSAGRTVTASRESGWLADLETQASVGKTASRRLVSVEHGGRQWRVLRSEMSIGESLQTPFSLVLAIDVTAREEFAARYRSRLVAAAFIAALLAGAIGLPLVRNALAPLRTMARQAREISANRLDERLPQTGVPAELCELSQAFNHMLERLQDSFRRLSQFSSDLAHDLRTPITNLMGEAQVALGRPRSVDEYQATLASAVEEYERINRMIEGMLFLARADDARGVMSLTRLDGRHAVAELGEYFEGLLEEGNLTLQIDGQASICANPDLFRRALSNLVANAIAHTPPNNTITVKLSNEYDGSSQVVVSNPGPGIPSELLPRVFDRLFRVDAARRGSHKGSGLGLAIVKSIMQLHGGSAAVQSTNQETAFLLRFPAVADAGGDSITQQASPPVPARGRDPLSA